MRPSIFYSSQTISMPTRSVATSLSTRKHLEFKPMTLDDIALLRHYLPYNIWRTCDYTLGGWLMWADYFDYHYCVIDDTLFVMGRSESDRSVPAFSLPLGKMPLSKSLLMIADFCCHHNIPMNFSAIPAGIAGHLADMVHGTIEPLQGWSDYLYDAHSLADLSGKALSKKRNHVNRFFADNPSAQLQPITADDIPEVLRFMRHVNLDGKASESAAAYELQQCMDVATHLDDYQFDAALLRDDLGAICAVTFGEVVGDTLYVHIEKMDHDVAGAGEAINKLFASVMLKRYPQIKYINREEDMSDEGLRLAKESYRPIALLSKFNVTA